MMWGMAKGIVTVAEEQVCYVLRLGERDPRPLQLVGGAALIWTVLRSGPTSTRQLLEELSEAVGIEKDALRGDVEEVLGDLELRGLVTFQTSTGSGEVSSGREPT